MSPDAPHPPDAQARETDLSAALIERLLGEPELRRRFLADPGSVLHEHGLPELAAELGRGRRALLTLELRESRSSLAGVMVAAAAEAVDLAHVAEHAAPRLEHAAGRAIGQLFKHPAAREAHPAVAPAAKPDLAAGPSLPPMAAKPQPPQPAGVQLPQTDPAPGSSGAGATAGGAGAQSTAPSAPAVTAPAGRLGEQHAQLGGTGAHHPPHPEPASAGTGAAPDVLSYPGDSATPQQIAAWMAARALKAGLPGELPVMAALTESGLRNLNYGDRDSVGFFQMRLGIWNEGPYLGYPDHPELQLQWFIDHALAVKAQYPGLAANPNTWGEWVANVEQPAAEYRYRYQLQLGMAQELLHGANLNPPPPAPPVPVGQAALKVALQYLRAPAAGGDGHERLDASGLVRLAYAREGINLPPVAAEQYDVGLPVDPSRLRLGDAVFFTNAQGNVDQVGLYVGSGRFVIAPEAGGPARILPLSDPGPVGRFAGARRYTIGAVGDPKSYARPLPTLGSLG